MPALQTEDFAWGDERDGVLDFARGEGFRCVVNVSAERVDVAEGWTVALASGPLEDGRLPRDTAAWLVRDAPSA